MTPPPPPQGQYPQPPPPQQPVYYAPPVQPAGPAPGVTYAGFLVRFIAYLVDGFIQGLIVWAFVIVGGLIAAAASTGDQSAGAGAAIGIVVLLAGVVVGLLWKPWFWSHGGQTPAYKILHLRVVRAHDGGPLGFGTAIGRLIGYVISGMVLYLGFIWVALDSRKQGWHDKLASTVVIQG
jgi:uncharacterized RDD family membrane protein YckC